MLYTHYLSGNVKIGSCDHDNHIDYVRHLGLSFYHIWNISQSILENMKVDFLKALDILIITDLFKQEGENIYVTIFLLFVCFSIPISKTICVIKNTIAWAFHEVST